MEREMLKKISVRSVNLGNKNCNRCPGRGGCSLLLTPISLKAQVFPLFQNHYLFTEFPIQKFKLTIMMCLSTFMFISFLIL